MIIESVIVKNYRSIEDECLPCQELTALVGANGSGKSSFLQALDMFYSPSPKIDAQDFYDGDISKPIIVAITFKNLISEAKELFDKYIQDERLTVERVFSWDNGKISSQYHGASRQCADFQPIRDGFNVNVATAKAAYNALRSKPDYSSLPSWTNASTVQETLKQWEATNLDRCVRQRDDGQFFGFKTVGQGYLGRFTRFLFIPAVRDASHDAADGKGSVLTDLMDLVVRSILANKEAVRKLKDDTQNRYKEILDPTKLTELTTLADKLSVTLREYVPQSSIDLKWLPLEEINIPMPRADAKLVEDGYSATVARTGHGLQRAFILTLLQHLAIAQVTDSEQPAEGTSEEKSKLSNLVLAIEEPELYQHPNRQRHFAKVLFQLAHGKTPGVAEKTQIVYCTHSPLFVGIDRINQIRLLRKIVKTPGKPKATTVVFTNLNVVAEKIWEATDQSSPKYSEATMLPRLQAIMTPWINEGFFSDVAVLVEGEDDRAAILGVARSLGHDLESLGISILPCYGKTNLDRPFAILHQLGIPVYLVWDSDKGEKDAKPKENHLLLKLLGESVADWPSTVKANFACFEENLEKTLSEEIGATKFESLLSEFQKDLGITKRKYALKNPAVISSIIQKASSEKLKSKTLEDIVRAIIKLKT